MLIKTPSFPLFSIAAHIESVDFFASLLDANNTKEKVLMWKITNRDCNNHNFPFFFLSFPTIVKTALP